MTKHQQAPASEARHPIPWKTIVLFMVIAALTMVGWFYREELDALLVKLKAYINELGIWGPVVYTGLFIIWVLLGLPEVVIALLGGVVFESYPIIAVISISLGSTLGAALSFVVSRYIAREPFQRWIGERGKLARLDRITTRYGVWAVAIARLTPFFPLTLINYGFGLTHIGFWKFLIVSWICIIPTAIFYVALGVGAWRAFHSGEISWDMLGIAAGILVVLLIAGLSAARLIKQAGWMRSDHDDHHS